MHAVRARRGQVRSGQRAQQPRGALARARGRGARDQPRHRVQRAVPAEVRRVVQLAAPVPERAQANKEEQNVRSAHCPLPAASNAGCSGPPSTRGTPTVNHSQRTVCERRPGFQSGLWLPPRGAALARLRLRVPAKGGAGLGAGGVESYPSDGGEQADMCTVATCHVARAQPPCTDTAIHAPRAEGWGVTRGVADP